MATKRATKRTRNISEGYVDANGVFHPIRSASDYRAKRAGEVKKYATGKKRKVSKAKKTVTVAHKRVAAKKSLSALKAALKPKRRAAVKNPLPTNKWTAVDKVKLRSDGSIQIMIRPGR